MENDKDVVAGSIEERDEEFVKDPTCEQERGERCKRKKKVMKDEQDEVDRALKEPRVLVMTPDEGLERCRKNR